MNIMNIISLTGAGVWTHRVKPTEVISENLNLGPTEVCSLFEDIN